MTDFDFRSDADRPAYDDEKTPSRANAPTELLQIPVLACFERACQAAGDEEQVLVLGDESRTVVHAVVLGGDGSPTIFDPATNTLHDSIADFWAANPKLRGLSLALIPAPYAQDLCGIPFPRREAVVESLAKLKAIDPAAVPLLVAACGP